MCFEWDEAKNLLLRFKRNLSFERVVESIAEEKELKMSIEQDEWKQVKNFSAVKSNLINYANSTKKPIFNNIRKMAFA